MKLIIYMMNFRYVSDQAYGSYKSYCQHKILCWESDSLGRLFPPTLLEWKALKETTSIAVECEMADGEYFIV